MSAIHIVGTLFGVALAFLPYGALFGLIPPFGLALAKRLERKQWLIPESRDKYEARVPYFILGILGGIAGAIVAVGTLAGSEQWICYSQHQLCNDGQGGILLIFTLPFFSIVCSSIALVWTSWSFRIPEESAWASIFRYSGKRRTLNWLCAVTTQIVFWSFFTAAVFRITLATL